MKIACNNSKAARLKFKCSQFEIGKFLKCCLQPHNYYSPPNTIEHDYVTLNTDANLDSVSNMANWILFVFKW